MDTTIYIQSLTQKLSEYGLNYIPIDDSDILEVVYKLYLENNLAELDDGMYLFYRGSYEQFVIQNDVNAISYYQRSIVKENIHGMMNLGKLYEKQTKYTLVKKYYLMAHDHGYTNAAYILADLYVELNDYTLAEKYYLLGIDKGNYIAMSNLAFMYRKQNKCELAEKYYLMAIDNGAIIAAYNLANIYCAQGKLELAKKYYLMAAHNHHTNAKQKINDLLVKQFDLDFAIKASEYLNESNLHMLNSIICYCTNNLDPTFNMRLASNMVCMKCQNVGETVFLSCGHPICTKCYPTNAQCVLCKKN